MVLTQTAVTKTISVSIRKGVSYGDKVAFETCAGIAVALSGIAKVATDAPVAIAGLPGLKEQTVRFKPAIVRQ